LYGFSDRRLRECFTARPDVVKKAWKTDSKGKRLYVEYWISPPPNLTKKKEIEWATEFLEKQNGNQKKSKINELKV
jgi:hypothetical protein